MEARRNIKVAEEVDREVRIHLAERGLKRGALSRFVEEVVREKLHRVSVEEVKKPNAGYLPEEVEAAVAEAVSEARRTGSPRH
jgi:hypothetical protein